MLNVLGTQGDGSFVLGSNTKEPSPCVWKFPRKGEANG